MNENKPEKINISGMDIFITPSSSEGYHVVCGSILVYILPVFGDTLGRRMFLAEMPEGSLIPGLCHRENDSTSWTFGFVALEHAEITALENYDPEKTRRSFAEAAGLNIADNTFEDYLVEMYSLNSVKEEGDIYNIRRKNEETKESSLKIIRDIFLRNDAWTDNISFSGKALYDSIAFVCAYEKIQIAPYKKIAGIFGREYTIDDIARISHFTIRRVVLRDRWYKKDGGAFVAFESKTNRPLCIIPSGYGKYSAYDVREDREITVDRSFARELKPEAIMLYRPLPNEKITLSKLVLFGLSRVYRSDIIHVALLAVIGVLTGLFIPYLNQLIFDRFIPLGDSEALIQIGAVILSCSVGNIAFTVVKNLSAFRAMTSMEYSVQSAVIDRLFSLPESFFRKYEAADLGIRAMAVTDIYEAFTEGVITSILSALFSFIYILRMRAYSGMLTLKALSMLAAALTVVVITGLRQIRYERQKIDCDRALSSSMFQYVKGIEKIRTSSSENRALLNYIREFARSRSIDFRKEKMTVHAGVFIGAVQVLFSVVFYFVTIHNGLNLSIGSFMGFVTAFGALEEALFELTQNFLLINKIKPIYEMTRPILETLPESQADSTVTGELTGNIEIDNISFAYNDDEAPALSGINLRISSGEYVAIVGASGAGKTTLMKLLLGFEKPQIGCIYYDGNDLDKLDKRELRKKFGVVLQNGALMGGTIYENITITSPGCSKSRVEEVIKQVGLENDIKAMPMGLHTIISEGSSTISGGQMQRIMLARAIVGNPKVILLDEATSALDNVTQCQVMDTLKKLDATKIVIAHRLSTVVNCDRIIVMDKGRVVEEGTYEELMDLKGRFYELAARQIA